MVDTTTAHALAERDLQALLDSVGGNYVAAYNEIVEDEQRKALDAKPRSSAEVRRLAYAKAVRTMDKAQLDSMAKTVRGFMPLVRKNSDITATTGVLDETQAEALMVEVLEVKRLQEIAKSRYDEIRKRVFNSITESFAEQGEAFPEHISGYIEVPNLALKFTREGCGRKDPEPDEAVLEKLVGPEIWEQVTTVEIIPAQEIRSVDMDLFLAAARRKPALLEDLRKALKVGAWKAPSFHQRAMDPEE